MKKVACLGPDEKPSWESACLLWCAEVLASWVLGQAMHFEWTWLDDLEAHSKVRIHVMHTIGIYNLGAARDGCIGLVHVDGWALLLPAWSLGVFWLARGCRTHRAIATRHIARLWGLTLLMAGWRASRCVWIFC